MQRLSANVPLVAAVVLCALALAGPDVSASQVPDILLTRAESSASGPNALPGGTLEIDLERGCVLLQGSPVVWPRGTKLATAPVALRFPNGSTARPGDVVRGGGGGGYAWQIRQTKIRIDGDLDRALRCAPRGASLIVFNARAGMRVRPRMLVTHALNVSESDTGMMLRGRLSIDAGRECILAGGKPVLWPSSTTFWRSTTRLRLPSGDIARTGDVVRGRGWMVRPAALHRKSLWVEGDLERALACAPEGSNVVVFRGPGTRMIVSRGG